MPKEISVAFQTDKTPQRYAELARFVDPYAFDAVSVYCDAPFHPSFGPLLLMAPHIRQSRLSVAAVSPSRMHPIDIAANTALLAGLAQAGVSVGLARGAWLSEHGIPEKRPAIAAIRETVAIVRHLLRGETGGYQGEVFSLAEHVRAPYPLPENADDIPVLIGTWGPKLCAVAGEIADEVKVGGSANPDVVPVIADMIAVGEAQAGRERGSVGVVMGAVTVVDEDRQQARQAARRAATLYLPVIAQLDPTVQIDPALLDRLRISAERGEEEQAAGLISDALLDRFAFAGDADDLIRQADALFAAGASRVEFGTPHGLHQAETGLRLIGERVLPALRANWPR